MDDRIAAAARRTLTGERLGRDVLLEVVERARHRPLDLFYWANLIRRRVFGNRVRLCSIVPGKLGGCAEDCKWCAQSAAAAPGVTTPRRTDVDEVRQAARRSAAIGASSIGIVNSGRGPTARDLADVVDFVAAVQATGDIEVCASLGQIDDDQARVLAEAGVLRYHHNLETSRAFFPNVVSTHGYDGRLASLAAAGAAGMKICSGGIFGIGETWQDRIDLAITLRDQVRPDVVPLNFLVPIDGTPLGSAQLLPAIEALTIVAMFRLVLPTADIKVAGGREPVLADLQSWIFLAGATSCMVGDYLTLHGRQPEDDLRMIADLGLTVTKKLQPRPDWQTHEACESPAFQA